MKKGLEELVKEVNYKKDMENYIPSDYAFRVVNTIKLIHGEEGTENKTPIIHYKMLDNINKSNNSLSVAFRGSAKSSLNKYVVFDTALYGDIPFGTKGKYEDVDVAIYVSDTMDNGVKTFFTNLKFTWDNSAFLQEYLPKARFTQDECELINKDGHRFSIKGFGVSTGFRGYTRYNNRPRLAILDDLFTDKNAQSPTVVKDIEDIIDKAIEQALHPKYRKFIWTGTPFNKKDPLYKTSYNESWSTIVLPVCNKFPCTREDFVSAWEDRFDYDSVNSSFTKLLNGGKVDAFNQEMMLRILSDEDRVININDIIWYKRDEVLRQKYKYNFYITTDFATSEDQKADYSVISVWAYNANGDWLWVDGILERRLMDKNIDDIFRFVSIYKPQAVGVEISGQQKGFVAWLRSEMLRRNIFFTIASDKASGEEGFKPNTSKFQRFNTVVPLFKLKKIWFPEELKGEAIMAEAIDELTYVTTSGFKSVHDDFIDTISMLSLMNAWKPVDNTYGHEEPTNSNSSYSNSPFSSYDNEEDSGCGMDSYTV